MYVWVDRCIFTGMATAIDTLCSQAHGAKQYRVVGATFARGTLVTAFTTFPVVGTLWYYMQDILVVVGELCRQAPINQGSEKQSEAEFKIKYHGRIRFDGTDRTRK